MANGMSEQANEGSEREQMNGGSYGEGSGAPMSGNCSDKSLEADFVTSLSREIRSPMTTILGHLDLLEEAGEHGDTLSLQERRKSLRTIRRNTEHLLELVNDVLDFFEKLRRERWRRSGSPARRCRSSTTSRR